MIHNLILAVDALDVDRLQNGANKLLAQTHTACDGEHPTADILPAVALQNRHIVGLLDLSYFVARVHTAIQEVENLGVNLVDLTAADVELVVELGVIGRLGAPHDVVNHRDAVLRCNLLRRVAPRLVGCDVALDHHTVEA